MRLNSATALTAGLTTVANNTSNATLGTALLNSTTTSGSTNILVSSTAALQKGMAVSGTGIPAGAYITGIVDATNYTISAQATASGAANVTLTHSTSATLDLNGQTVTAGNVNLNGFGAALRSNGSTLLRNTIVANSVGAGNCFGAITNGGNNIDDGATCGWGAVSSSRSSTNPLLGALATNGGRTRTFALLAGSPAIDGVTFSAPNGAPSTDQRGVARPQGVRYDIGAYEYSSFPLNAILFFLFD